MRRIIAFCLGGAALSAAALAQETSAPPILVPAAPSPAAPAADVAKSAPSPAPAGNNAANAAAKPQSGELNAMLSATMPSYAPAPPPPPPKPEAESVDLRDVDKPKNRIVRLPKYVVHADKPPIFRPQDLYSADGIARLAMLRYQGLGLLPGAQMNSGIGTEMWREQDRLNNMASLEDTAATMQNGGDKDEAKFIRQISNSTYQQGLDWGTSTVPGQNPSAYGANGLK